MNERRGDEDKGGPPDPDLGGTVLRTTEGRSPLSLLSRIHSFIMLMQSECTWPEVGGEGSTCRERSML